MANNDETQTIEYNSEIQHEHTLYSETISQTNNFTITNSLLNSWLVIGIIVIIGLIFRKKITIVPVGMQNIFEMIVEKFLVLFDSVTKSRKKTLSFFPFVFAFFVFIL